MNDAFTVVKIVVKSDVREAEISLRYETYTVGLTDFSSLGLHEGDVLDEETFDKLQIFDSELKCMKKAVQSLSYAPKNTFMLRVKLRRFFNDDIIDAVIAKLISLGFVDDSDLAMRCAEKCARSKRWGPVRIRQELFKNGYCEDDIASALEAVDNEIYEESVKYHLRTHFGAIEAPDYDTKCLIRAYLYKYGFTQKEYSDILSEL